MEQGIIIGFILYIYFDVINIPHYLTKMTGLRRVKPFDCELCLSFWVSVGISVYYDIFVCFENNLYITALRFIVTFTVIKLLRQ
jgi:hypothetical protein